MSLNKWSLVTGVLFTSVSAMECASAEPRPASDFFSRTFRASDGRAIYTADEVKLTADETLVFEEPAIVHIKKLRLENAAKIDSLGNKLEVLVKEEMESDGGVMDASFNKIQDTSGAEGLPGDAGEKALDGLKGVGGGGGQNGGHATDGGDGAPISILTPILRGNVVLISRGGNGQKGGNGGAGGNGGVGFSGQDARLLYHFRGLDNLSTDTLLNLASQLSIPYVGEVLIILQLFNGLTLGDGFDGFDGGKGGNGGMGGNGSNGGKGGDVSLVFGQQIEGDKISVYTSGGRGGPGGLGGLGGIGGMGGEGGKRGDIWAREGNPGKAGDNGVNGVNGTPGKPGASGKVNIVEAGNPEWMFCYIQYKEMLNLEEDKDFAREMFRTCTQAS